MVGVWVVGEDFVEVTPRTQTTRLHKEFHSILDRTFPSMSGKNRWLVVNEPDLGNLPIILEESIEYTSSE